MAKVRLSVDCPGAKTVCIAGDFNNWDPEARRMKRVRRDESEFIAVLELEPGTYEFKYVVDGEWMCCPNAPRVTNEHGTQNSVLEVSE